MRRGKRAGEREAEKKRKKERQKRTEIEEVTMLVSWTLVGNHGEMTLAEPQGFCW